jgi:hypothetical protein
MRYAYGGSPLWCTFPWPDIDTLVPSCEYCGASRQFELQLMPAILNLPIPTVNSSSDQLLGDCLDFGVVAIFSCPNSCPNPDGYTEEIALVQPSPDLI